MFDKRRERIDAIMSLLNGASSIHIKEASSAISVSEMTLRRDIANSNGVLSCLGGYIVKPDQKSSPRYTLDQEKTLQFNNKQMVGQVAADLISDGDTVFIDCGTTTPHIVSALPSDKKITAICYSLNVADLLSHNPNVMLFLLGGMYYPASASFHSEENISFLRKMGVNKAFLSAGGVDLTRGLSCSHLHEVSVKQAAMSVSVQKIVVADSSKFGRIRSSFFGDLKDIDTVITDSGLSSTFRSALASSPIELICAP